ncbi:MAG: LysM peptidoglycan-binding domain-containing protein [Verrucomicrobia bacterium]|nr:LysM peptidoglycan-binding domain-containing protein [Verrucomicrobiota bacterium]
MNNPNPFVPKGSLLEQQGVRRSRLKIMVSCVLAVSILGLVGMLIQGCKREQPADNTLSNLDTNPPVMTDTNPPAMVDTNPIANLAPPTNVTPVVIPPVVETAPGTVYAVAKGDTLSSIAKAHHITLSALQSANTGVDAKHLKVGQKLTIPASTTSATAPAAMSAVAADTGADTYVVKSGDTLTTIAKKHSTTVKALEAANNLTTTKIKVGQKLKLPSASAPAPAPVDTTPAVAPAPMTVPTPAPAPAR